jgi:hypothetical protein
MIVGKLEFEINTQFCIGGDKIGVALFAQVK